MVSQKIAAGLARLNTFFIQYFPYARPVGKFLRTHWKKEVVILVIGVPALLLIRFLTSVTPPQYVLADAKRGELIQTVEAVGTITSEKDLELKFPVSGVVDEVTVDEGDAVVRGQVLARLRSGSAKAAVASAVAALTTAQAELQAKIEGTRPEDIAIAEAELANKKASLELAKSRFENATSSLTKAQQKLDALREEAKVGLQGEINAEGSTANKDISVAQTSIGVVEDVFLDVTLENILVQQQPFAYAELKTQLKAAKEHVQIARMFSYTPDDYRQALQLLKTSRAAVSETADVVQSAYDFIAKLDPLALFSADKRESMKVTLAAEKKNMLAALTDIDDAVKSLQDSSAGYDTKIATEESNFVSAQNSRDQAQGDIQTYQTAVSVSQAQLDLKKAGSRASDVDASRGRVQQARANLLKAQSDLDDTVLVAPIDGTITKVNLKPGEFTPGQFSATDAAMTILGNSPYRTELYTSEIDIPKVHLLQTGAILLDAFPTHPFGLRVSEIDPAATTVDGVPKYRVVLDFLSPDAGFKIGMTGDVDIVTDSQSNVVFVPGRAVVKDEQGRKIVRVLNAKGVAEDRLVETGMETINDIEIRSGIAEGDQVIVLIKK